MAIELLDVIPLDKVLVIVLPPILLDVDDAELLVVILPLVLEDILESVVEMLDVVGKDIVE